MYHNDHLIQTNTVPHSLTQSSCTTPPFISSCSLVALALTKHITVLLKRRTDELSLLPQIGSEEAVAVSDSDEGSLERVLEGLGRAGRSSVDIADTCELQQTLDGWRGDEAGTAWSWNELRHISIFVWQLRDCMYTYTNGNGTTLAALLGGDGVRFTEVGTPVATTNWHDGEFGDDDSRADSSSDFLRRLDTKSDMSLAVADDNDSLESRTLTSTCLLLHWLDLFTYPLATSSIRQ